MDDHSTPARSEPGNRTTREQAVRNAARHVIDSLARQDARTPLEAAVASLGADVTDEQIAVWIQRYRVDDPDEGVAPTPDS